MTTQSNKVYGLKIAYPRRYSQDFRIKKKEKSKFPILKDRLIIITYSTRYHKL